MIASTGHSPLNFYPVETGLSERRSTLVAKARFHNQKGNLARLGAIGAVAATIHGGPLIEPLWILGAVGYASAIALDWLAVEKLILLPSRRKIAHGLAPWERTEYRLLVNQFEALAELLRLKPPGERVREYQRLIQEAFVHGELPLPVQQLPTPASPPAAVVVEVGQPQSSPAYLNNLIEYPSLIYGGMGAGKSWTARFVAQLKVEAGHRVIVLDPHAASHEWRGITHLGAGMDYAAIAEFLEWYLSEIEARYQDFSRSGRSEEQWQQQLRQEGQVLSVICEEITNWADRLPKGLPGRFFKSAITDSRKVLMPPLLVAHDRTLSALGEARGLAHLRDSSLLELELLTAIHPQTFKPVSSGKGRLKLPGQSQFLAVELPKVSRKITEFQANQGANQTAVSLPPNQAKSGTNQVNPGTNQVNPGTNQGVNQGANQIDKEEINQLLNRGISRSKIIKDYLGFKGVNYQKGAQLLNRILAS